MSKMRPYHRPGSWKQTRMCIQEVSWGLLSGRRGLDWADGEGDCGATLIGSQPGKLKS